MRARNCTKERIPFRPSVLLKVATHHKTPHAKADQESLLRSIGLQLVLQLVSKVRDAVTSPRGLKGHVMNTIPSAAQRCMELLVSATGLTITRNDDRRGEHAFKRRPKRADFQEPKMAHEKDSLVSSTICLTAIGRLVTRFRAHTAMNGGPLSSLRKKISAS